MSVTAVHRKADRSLNSLGYPLRPDGQAEICRYFAETGYCKYSTSCKHHHPEEYCTKRIERQQARQEREKNAEIAAKRNTTTEEVTPAGSGPKQQQKTPSPDQASKPTAVKETSTTTKTAAPENEDEDWTPVKRGKAPKKTSADAGAANTTTTTLPQTTAPSKLIGFNSRGFPLREGADECQYYVNTLGLCRHGQYCKHTHPEWICEFAQDKPRAIIAPQYQGKTGLAGKHSEKPQPEIPKDPAAMRAEIQRQLKALGLPSNACYYHFVLDNCRNQNCVWKHEVSEEDLLSVSDAENEEAREEEPDIVEKIAAVEKEIPRNNKPATKQTAAEVVKKSLIEQQADTIVSKLKLSPALGPSIVDAAKGCGAKESLAEIATSILSQALLLKKMSGEEMRTICKEVALLRASKTT